MKLPAIALGTWSWGSGAAGGDQVFGNHTDAESLKSVFDAAYSDGLTMWDTATVYGMGSSEDILGGFISNYPRDKDRASQKLFRFFERASYPRHPLPCSLPRKTGWSINQLVHTHGCGKTDCRHALI